MTDTTFSSRPLHLQTIDSLFADLIGGASVSSGTAGERFRLDDLDSRKILNWYRLNKQKWAGKVMATDVDAIALSLQSPIPSLPAVEPFTSGSSRRLKIFKVVAHRFAGLHSYGTAEAAPPDFVFEPKEAITLFEGWNGAGKTSLLNSIIWCLTGELLRPQRPPEKGEEEFEGFYTRTVDGEDQTAGHTLTPITPLPNPAHYMPPVGRPVPIDSWVEITFVDQDGNLLSPVRRTQVRNVRGKVTETVSGLDELGVDPISLRIGTVMPALLQFLRVGSASDMGKAAARLTGLADISDLAKHAGKAREKLMGELKKERESEIDDIDTRFLQARSDLQKQIDEYPMMAPKVSVPSPSSSRDVEEQLTALASHFSSLKADAFRDAQKIFGPAFDPSDKAARDELEANIGPAQGQLKSMGQLANVQRLRLLGELKDEDWSAVDELVSKLRAEAATLAELAKTPRLGIRKQLYARVAGWISDQNEHDPESCGICSRSLVGVMDPVTSRSVLDHLAEVSEAEQKLLSLTHQTWASSWNNQLVAKVPSTLQAELARDLPGHPSDLIRGALVDDLFETEAFGGLLGSLKNGVELLCQRELEKLPGFTEPTIDPLPPPLDAVAQQIMQKIKRLARAKSFARWRLDYREELGKSTQAILQGGGEPAEISETTPVSVKLEALASIAKGVTPLNAALEFCGRMETQLKARRNKEVRLELYERGARALEKLVELGTLSEKQVDLLRSLLHRRATYWRDRCYHNSYPMAGHGLRQTAMDTKGVLDIRVGFESANAPAQHISNSSALRANLMGFFLAFWEHVFSERGGIALLIFDDPQELLDHDNKEKLARLLPELAKKGAQVIVATYDRFFARAAVAAGREFSGIEHRSVHPVNPYRDLTTSAATEELERRRDSYHKDKDSPRLAQDYASEVRIFLEARLADLFDDPAYPSYVSSSRSPTLADHLGHLNSLISSPPNALFKGRSVSEFAKSRSLAQGSACLRVLNASHHNRDSLSAGDVFAVAGEFETVCKLAEKMHVEFRHWRWREPMQESAAKDSVVAFPQARIVDFHVMIHPDLAAFTASSGHEASQDSATETLDQSWFEDKSLFLIRQDNLGFALPSGCIAIVESVPYEGRDHNLVIARQKGNILARRLFKPANGEGLALAAEAPDPQQSRPTLIFDQGAVVLYRIVGMLTEQPAPLPGRGEAVALDGAESLARIRTAYRVREESGIPLALPGQIVLGGDLIGMDELSSEEGTLVALTLADGKSVFKRIGARVPGTGGRMRQFESVGGLGSSLVVSLSAEFDEEAPHFAVARRVLGVLYRA